MKRMIWMPLLPIVLACTAQHIGNPGVIIGATHGPVSAAQLQAFQTTVYAFGNSYNCVKCHGGAVNPQWMNPDLATAYSLARTLLNVDDPTASIFASYVANNHCNDPVCTNAANIPIMQDLLLQWAAVEVNQASNGPATTGQTLSNPPFVTPTVAIPAGLPLITAAGGPSVIRFDLSSLAAQVPALSGAMLEISIETYNSIPTTYKIFNPRIVGNSAAVTVSGLHVYVRPAAGGGLGTEDVNQGDLWYGVTATTAAMALPSPLPTGPITTATPLTAISLGVAVQSAADVITVGFASIQ